MFYLSEQKCDEKCNFSLYTPLEMIFSTASSIRNRFCSISFVRTFCPKWAEMSLKLSSDLYEVKRQEVSTLLLRSICEAKVVAATMNVWREYV